MKLESYTKEWSGPAFGVGILGPMEVCCDLVEDLPVLRVWNPENGEQELVHLILLPEAARKLAVQLLAAAQGNRWEETVVAIERNIQERIVASRGRMVALEPS